VAEVELHAIGPDGNEITSASIAVSVPQFVEVAGDTPELDALFTAWHLATRKAEILKRTHDVAQELMSLANVRLVWTAEPLGQTLPPQFIAGGAAEGSLSRVTLGDTSASGFLIDGGETTSVDLHNDQVRMNLRRLIGKGVPGGCMDEMIARLGDAAPPAGLEAFAVEYFARFIGKVVAGCVRLLLFGQAFPDREGTMAEITGYDIAPGADPGLPASYTDHGIAAMHFGAETQTLADKYFPVPPAFK
jgi:hypothetical protein